MFNLKKVIASLCVTAIAATSMMIPAMAATLSSEYTLGLATSTHNEYDDGYTYITVVSDGFTGDDGYTSAGTLKYQVTKGVFSAVTAIQLGRRNNTDGLYAPKALTGGSDQAASFDISLNTGVSPDYDLLTVTWYGAYETYMTNTGEFIDIELEYAGDEVDAVFTPVNTNFATAVDENKVLLADKVTLSEASKVSYKLAAATHEISVVESADPEPYWVTADVQEFSSEADNSVAIAARATLSAAEAEGDSFDTVTWKVAKGEVVKGRRSALNPKVEGEGTVTVGLAIGGLNKADVTDNEGKTTVWAALGAWGN